MFDESNTTEWTGVYERSVTDERGYEQIETRERFVTGDGEIGDRYLDEGARIERRLLGYATARAKLDAAEAFDLSRAYDLKLHLLRGYASFFEYMERVLHYAPHTARERLRVSRALVGLPVMSAALSRGELAYSHVRELTRIATSDNERAWLDAIEHRNSTEVQAMVAGRALGDLPTDPQRRDLRPKRMTLELPPDVMALWRDARKALADERGSSDISDAALLETLCRRFLNPGSEDGPPHTIGYLECPECGHGKQIGGGRQFDVDDHVMERARCDARILGDLTASHPERAVSSVTPRMREQVLAAFGGACAVPGCRSSRCLEIHHVIPQAQGGPHEMWNLAPLCDGHHVADHLGLLKIAGRAPFDLTFEWVSPPMKPAPLPRELAMIVDDDVPAATPGLDPALQQNAGGSSQQSAARGRVVPTRSEHGELPGCVSCRDDSVRTRDSTSGADPRCVPAGTSVVIRPSRAARRWMARRDRSS